MMTIEKCREQFEIFLAEYLRTLPLDTLHDPVRYILGLGGKRMRPALTLMSCGLFNENISLAKNAALAVEVFHNFTLMHDDIMDNAPLRRGKPTAHIQWNTSSAILSGDAMLVHAYKLLTENSHSTEQLRIFNDTALAVCNGQQRDMEFEKEKSITGPEYIDMIRMKTSALLGCALRMGAIAGEASVSDQQHLEKFGIDLGISFQLWDDFLDAFGDEKKTGKKRGGDILSGKKTYLFVSALTKADDSQRLLLNDLFCDPAQKEDERIDRTVALYETLGVKRDLQELVEEYHHNALEHLDALQLSKEKKKPLFDLANSLVNRQS